MCVGVRACARGGAVAKRLKRLCTRARACACACVCVWRVHVRMCVRACACVEGGGIPILR